MTWDALVALAIVGLAALALVRRLWSPEPKCGSCPVAKSAKKPSQRKKLAALSMMRKGPLGRL